MNVDGAEVRGEPFVQRRGRFERGLFLLFIVTPCVVGTIATVWFCVSQHKPYYVAVGVLVACLLVIDHFAYDTFCEITLTPTALIYRGGGMLLKKLRREKVLPWTKYVCSIRRDRARYGSLYVRNKDRMAACSPSRRELVWPALVLRQPILPCSEFDAFVRQLLIYNPEVVVKSSRPPRSPGAVLVRRGNISIIGDSEFRRKTVAALALLKERDPVNYRRVQRYIRSIESVQSGPASGIDVETAACEVNRETRILRIADKWYAAVIARQMCVLMLHRRFRVSVHNPKHYRKCIEICLNFETRCLRRIGASELEIERLEEEVRKHRLERYEDLAGFPDC